MCRMYEEWSHVQMASVSGTTSARLQLSSRTTRTHTRTHEHTHMHTVPTYAPNISMVGTLRPKLGLSLCQLSLQGQVAVATPLNNFKEQYVACPWFHCTHVVVQY